MSVAKLVKLAVVPVLLAASLAAASSAAASSAAGPEQAAPAKPRCPAWDGVQLPGDNGEALAGVATLTSCGAWAVGALPGPGYQVTVIDQLTGSSWAEQPSPPPGSQSGLAAVTATSVSNAWAVGRTRVKVVHALIEHWNGATWSTQQAAQPGGAAHATALTAVAAKSATDAWAVGYYQTATGRRTLIEHWNGATWTQVPSPSPAGPDRNSQLTGVAAVSATEAWAVGYYRAGKAGERTLILHWTGKKWQQAPSPSPSPQTVLTSVAATSADHAWAVGYAITGTGVEDVPITETVFLQWNGRRWTRIPTPNLIPLGGNELLGVAATQRSNIWVVGYDQRPGDFLEGLILHWDGTQWQVPTVPLSQFDGPEVLSGVATSAPGDVWAVGWASPSGDQGSPLILHFDGHSWQS
jgi:hypothetical protein